MFRGGALRSTDSDLVQACIKAMTSLFSLHNQMLARAARAKSDSEAARELKAIADAAAEARAAALADDNDDNDKDKDDQADEGLDENGENKKDKKNKKDSQGEDNDGSANLNVNLIRPSASSTALAILTATQLKEMRRSVIMPLSEDNIRSLVGLLTTSIMEVSATFQNAAFQLIR
jgi:hypothetical protein